MSEASIQSYVLKKLRMIPNSDWIKATTTNKAGTTDVYGHIKGRAIYIEIKRGGSRGPTLLQEYTIDRLQRQGAIAFWADSWDTISDKLRTEFGETSLARV
jgi:hypothetical protein